MCEMKHPIGYPRISCASNPTGDSKSRDTSEIPGNRCANLTYPAINMNLIKASKPVIDYVILHELCHLKIKGHSDKFWQMIKKFMPNYDEQKRWLELNNVIVS